MRGLTGRGEVDLAPLREAYERSGLRVCEVAKAGDMDWSHVARLLKGRLEPAKMKRGKLYGPYSYTTCTYETAVKLARAMDVDPYEVGL